MLCLVICWNPHSKLVFSSRRVGPTLLATWNASSPSTPGFARDGVRRLSISHLRNETHTELEKRGMSGQNLRRTCHGREDKHDYIGGTPGLVNNFARMYTDMPPGAVHCLIRPLQELVLTSTKPNNTDDLRIKLNNLVQALASSEFSTDLAVTMLRVAVPCFAVATMKAVDIGKPNLALKRPQMVVNPNIACPPYRVGIMQQPVLQSRGRGAASAVGLPRVPRPFAAMVTPVQSAQMKRAMKRPHQSAPAAAPALLVQPKDEEEKCNDCDLIVFADPENQIRHYWKKHKDKVYKIMRPEFVCNVNYCDFIAANSHSQHIHERRGHSTPLAEVDYSVVLDKPGKCVYCKRAKIDNLQSLKKHMAFCKKRDERPMLGCTTCSSVFHYTHDFVHHLKKNGHDINHGSPFLLGA